VGLDSTATTFDARGGLILEPRQALHLKRQGNHG